VRETRRQAGVCAGNEGGVGRRRVESAAQQQAAPEVDRVCC